MSLKQMVSKSVKGLRVGFVVLTVFPFSLGGPLVATLQAQGNELTRTPIKHVIVIVGENRSFDHVFATYKPKHGQHVDNLLSKKIINEDGTPGPEYSLAAQYSADITGSTEFQLTNTKGANTFTWDSYAASPVHRFYQMWQQADCNVAYATESNPSGCKSDLFTWTAVTVGSNVNGKAQPSNFSTDYSPAAKTTGEGGTVMGFYNCLQGDMPYFKQLADNYSMSDNYHQPAMGGTGLDSIMLGFGDAIWFSDANSNPVPPPENVVVWSDTPADTGTVNEIENPNPVPGTNNWWIQDGYGGGAFGSHIFWAGVALTLPVPPRPAARGPDAYNLSPISPPPSHLRCPACASNYY